MSGSTSRLAIPYPVGTDNVSAYPALASTAAGINDLATQYTQGVLAALPAASLAGRLYRATDTGQLFYDTGSAWQQLGFFTSGAIGARPAAASVAKGTVFLATDDTTGSTANGTFWISTGSVWDLLGGGTLATYKNIIGGRQGQSDSGQAAGTYVLSAPAGDPSNTLMPSIGSLTFALTGAPFYIDPADWAVSARTTKLRLRAQFFSGANPTGATWTVGLYPVSTWTSSNPTLPSSLGTVVAGSTVAFTTPAANTRSQGNSGDFTAPAAGFYVFGIVQTGAAAANSQAVGYAQLQMRQV